MPIDVNGQYYGQLYGQDRIGQTTPDLESSEWLRPWLPIAYPAPWLPTLRQDQGHPKLAGIVIGAHMLVGKDKNGGLVPAGYASGTTQIKADGGQYCVVVYSAADVGFAYNPQTSKLVASAGEYAVLAAPADGVVGDVVTLPNGITVTIKASDLDFAWKCDLFPYGLASLSGVDVSTVSTAVPIDAPVITASTLSAGATVTFAAAAGTDNLFGEIDFTVAGVPVSVKLLANTSIVDTVTAINAAITAAATALTAQATADTAAGNTAGATTATAQAALLTGTVAAQGGVGFTNQIILTGPVDATVAGTNAVAITNIALDDIGTASTAITYAYGICRPIGCAVRNVYQYIGGVNVGANVTAFATTSATGINYVLDGVVPVGFIVMNYMHEMGTAIQTQFVLKLPWIGATPTTLTTLASNDGVVGYVQAFGRTFTHFTGSGFAPGTGIAACSGADAGNFTLYNPAIHTPMDIVGRVLDVQNLVPVGFLNRVRTLFDRPMVGPMVDPNPAAIRMGGSATGGIPYHISVTTDAIFKRAYDQGKQLHPEYSTHVIVRVNL